MDDNDQQELVMLFDKDWLEEQPEPTSDCSDIDHYVALDGFGQCPSCFQREA